MIVNVIQSVVASLTPSAPAFYHAEQFEQNLNDDATFPMVYLEHPIKGKDLTPNNSPALAHSIEYTLNIFFLDKTNLDDTILDRQTIIDAMLALKRQFVVRLCNHSAVKTLGVVEHTEVYNVLDLNLDGVWTTLTVTLYDKDAVCLT